MKKRLLFMLIICLPCFSFGQVIPVDSFYVPGASWTEVVNTEYSPCSTGTETSTFGLIYKIERDTIISGKTYHLLSRYNIGGYGVNVDCTVGTSNYADTGSYTTSYGIFAMLRTDSNRVYFTLLTPQSGGIVFYDCDSVGVEYLFYDFNLGIDSVFNGSTLSYGITVSTIDSVSLSNGVYVKRYNGDWIYGIGAQNGFINYWSMYVCGPGPSASQFMLCYDNPNFSYQFSYPAGTLPGNLQNDCFDMASYIDSMTSVSQVTLPSITILYPNPATTELNISSPNTINRVTIGDLLGQTFFSQQYYTQQVQIDISDLPSGVYFIKINGSEVRKFVKE